MYKIVFFFFVFQVLEIEVRSVLIQLVLFEWDFNEFDIDFVDFWFIFLLLDKGKEGKYKLVYRYSIFNEIKGNLMLNYIQGFY